MSLLERRIATIENRLVLLSPSSELAPDHFSNTTVDPLLHQRLMGQMQRLRGRVYFQDGALQAHELSGGRHQLPQDVRSWHLLMLNDRQQVDACIYYLEHDNGTTLDKLRVEQCPLATQGHTREAFRKAVHAELASARRDGVPYAEVGGWAVSEEIRCSPDGLLLILATFGLSRVFGGALGLATATTRHSSAGILCRMGLSPLQIEGLGISSYFDPHYNCDMELLRFDTRRPNPKYRSLVELLTDRMQSCVTLVAATAEVMSPALARPALAETAA